MSETATTWTLQQALNQGLRTALQEDDRVLVFGEDVGRHGGVFRITDGLQGEFGDKRVFDTPLAEAGIVGTAVGLAMRGWRPVVEIQFAGFAFPAFNQIATHIAKFRTRSRGAFDMPITIRLPSYGGIKGPEGHSESTEGLFAQLPGMKVVAVSDAADAYTMLLEAIRDPDPVIFLEPMARYWATQELPDGVPTADRETHYKARIAREGSHVTLVCWGGCAKRCLTAAEFAAEDGVDVEVLDLRWLKPIDVQALVRSVRKTRRAVVVQEAPITLGLASEVSALLMDHCFRDLVAPVVRVAPTDMPYPSGGLESQYLPDADRILAAIAKTLAD